MTLSRRPRGLHPNRPPIHSVFTGRLLSRGITRTGRTSYSTKTARFNAFREKYGLIPLAFFHDDGLDVGAENLWAVANAFVHVAVDANGRPTRGIDGTATDGKGWRRHIFNTDCLVIANAAPGIFEHEAVS